MPSRRVPDLTGVTRLYITFEKPHTLPVVTYGFYTGDPVTPRRWRSLMVQRHPPSVCSPLSETFIRISARREFSPAEIYSFQSNYVERRIIYVTEVYWFFPLWMRLLRKVDSISRSQTPSIILELHRINAGWNFHIPPRFWNRNYIVVQYYIALRYYVMQYYNNKINI